MKAMTDNSFFVAMSRSPTLETFFLLISFMDHSTCHNQVTYIPHEVFFTSSF